LSNLCQYVFLNANAGKLQVQTSPSFALLKPPETAKFQGHLATFTVTSCGIFYPNQILHQANLMWKIGNFFA